MSEENVTIIIGALITAIGSIIGAVIGARTVANKASQTPSIDKSNSGIGIFFGAISGAILTVMILLATGSLSIPKFASTSNADIYDEFEDQRYEGAFDTATWMPIRYYNDKIFQQDGSLTVSDVADSDGGIVLRFRDDQINEFSFFEAKVRLSDKVLKGNGSSLVLMVISPSIPFANHIWFGIDASPTYLARVSKGGTGENLASKEINVREWHILGIEFNKNSRNLIFVLDGKSLFSYEIPGEEPIDIVPAIQIWHDERSLVEGYIDYVKLAR